MGERPLRQPLLGFALPIVAVVVVAPPAIVADAATTDSTTLVFQVGGNPTGDLQVTIAADGGLVLPLDGGTATARLTDATVVDSRGGGTREWSGSIATSGFGGSTSVEYKVDLPLGPGPGTGSITNRMPDWAVIGSPVEALTVNGISKPEASWTWTPSLRLDVPTRGSGSAGPGAQTVSGALITSVL